MMALYCINFVLVIFMCVHVRPSSEQTVIPSSPCPNMFQYQREGYEFVGLAQVQSLPLGQAMKLEVMLSLRAKLPSQYVGQVELLGSREDAIQEIRSNQRVRYRIRFPLQNVLPKLTQISLNGQVYCTGPAETGSFVTQIRLEHTLFTEVAAGHPVSGFDNYIYPYDPYVTYNNQDNYYSQIYKRPSAPDIPPQQPTYQQTQHSYQPQPTYQTQPPYQPQPTQRVQYVGQVELLGSREDAIQEIRSNQRVRYRIRFPLQNVLPKLTQISLNGQVYCTGPAETGSFVTQIRLEHTLFTEVAAGHPITGRVWQTSCEKQFCIIGGETVQRGAWPWLVAVYFVKPIGPTFNCGGNLVSARTVVTAAHCFRTSERTYQAHEITLFLGRHNIVNWMEPGVKAAQVEQIVIHSDYMSKDSSYDADIAVAIMRERVEFTEFIRPICLWEGSDSLSNVVGQMGTVIGWGRDNTGNVVTAEPKKINVPVVSEAECLRSSDTYRYITSQRTFCAGGRDGRGPCNGDSGGGMTFKVNNRWMLRGIVSAALADPIVNSCNLAEYIVFTDAAKFVSWIKSYMQ